MNIIICDICGEDRTILRKLLQKYEKERCERFAVSEYGEGTKLCEDREALRRCQIVFLDVTVDGQEGLKTAVKIKELYPEIYLVLMAAHMNYSLEGYKAKASRFLLKEDLEHTIGECMDSLTGEIHRKEQYVEFPFVEGHIRLQAQDILYIETSGHKNIFYTKKQTYTIYRKMDEIEAELADMGFVRIHRSFLVNMRHIEKISGYVLRLITGKEISVPKARYPEVQRRYALYKGAG